jgi:membrane protease YdiL (CAAX protease family)
MTIKSIFINDEPRLRAGWRLLLQTLFMGLILLGFTFPLSILAFIKPELITSPILNALVSFTMFTVSVFIARLWLDRRSLTSLGLSVNMRALKDILVGILITLPMIGLIYAILWGIGWLTFENFAWQVDPLSTVFKETLVVFIIFVLVGWSEELLSRGYHLQTIESGLNTFWAVVLSSVIFGILHLGNENSESILFVSIGIFLAGVFLAYGYLRTRQLWLPIGLHIGWNFFEGAVFGFPVSGMSTYQLMRITINGPELWTGGPFGPEAGLVLIPGLLLGFALIYIYTRGRTGPNPLAAMDSGENVPNSAHFSSGSSELGEKDNPKEGIDAPDDSKLQE